MGRFAIRARLGAGGMGEVYLAEDTMLKRSVALKRMAPKLRSDERYRHRFIKEAERASSLNDHRIAGIYDVFEERNETFLVMEYVEGMTLRERLKQPLAWPEFLPLAIECAQALVAAQEKGIVHRDLKPENIMLPAKGGVKILDFGVARRLPSADATTGSGDTNPREASGTLAYMAPEVLLEKESDERADLFSLGVVFYEVLAEQHPFQARSFVATSDRILHEEAAPLRQVKPELPETLERVVARLLAKDPAGRYAGATDLVAELRAAQLSEPLPPGGTAEAAKRPRWRKALVAAAGPVLGALLLVLLVPAVRRHFLPEPPMAVPQKKHLAVLPFTALAGDPETAAFSNGLAETVTARLGRVAERHGLDVVPAGEVRARRVRTLEEAQHELGVNLALEGSLQRAGGNVRVNYALVDVAMRRQLRADTITASAADVFMVEDRVVESILNNLEIALPPEERRVMAARGTTLPAAYDSYLQGRGYLQDYQRPENIQRAISLFLRALQLDPQDPLTRASLGEAYWKQYELEKDPALVGKSRQACAQALKQNPGLAEPHVCMGTLLNGTGQHAEAAQEFGAALQNEPNRDDAYRGLASAYESQGRLAEAEATYRRAIGLRPEYWAGYNWLGGFYFHVGRYKDAVEMFRKVTTLAPENYRGFSNLGAMQFQAGDWPGAEQNLKRSLALGETGTAYSNLGTLYFFEQRYEEAARAFEAAAKISPMEEYIWGNLADAYRWSPGGSQKAAETYAKAIALAEEALRVNPRQGLVLAQLALCRSKTQATRQATQTIVQALRWAPQDPIVLYSAAVVYNLAGQPDVALSWLRKAAKSGYQWRQIQADPEFRNLHQRPEFLQLAQTLERKGS